MTTPSSTSLWILRLAQLASLCLILLGLSLMLDGLSQAVIFCLSGLGSLYGFSLLITPPQAAKHAPRGALSDALKNRQRARQYNHHFTWAASLARNPIWQIWAISLSATCLLWTIFAAVQPAAVILWISALYLHLILIFVLFYGLGTRRIAMRRMQITLQTLAVITLLIVPMGWQLMALSLPALIWAFGWGCIAFYYLKRHEVCKPQRRLIKLICTLMLLMGTAFSLNLIHPGSVLLITWLNAYSAFLSGSFHRIKKQRYLGL